MIILDTNVLSELMKPKPEPAVLVWLDAQPLNSIWTTTVTLFEIRYGIAILPGGKKRDAIRGAFEVALQRVVGGRILDLDLFGADEAAQIAARLRAAGRTVDVRDVLIAGSVAARKATLATHNLRHFIDTGIQTVDPWQAPAP